ncbi:hypothetical protein [Histidinibacterium aquaticum]|uniref:Uncharacterized protein n=1 Tax=Histidinibacterium aquaticum TaxID=2613962 RepID=A0A5J5GAZ1_9RHOB|nr:hypothetical protein [Histidinibacterium aquaticum]KAA9005100.1 hypothetical protein F3S47_18910 [Histidinibacterium aquaticum]
MTKEEQSQPGLGFGATCSEEDPRMLELLGSAEPEAAVTELVDRDVRIAELVAQIEILEQDLFAARGRISEIYKSTSWKITAPLRSIMLWIRGRDT